MYTIYSKPSCSYCLQAKQLLEMKQLPFVYKQFGADYTLQELLEVSPTARTFPVILKGEELIGGFANLCEYLNKQY